jgi:hypothetical protein
VLANLRLGVTPVPEEKFFGQPRALRELLLSIHCFERRDSKPVFPRNWSLYCARHDYGTRVLTRTGNLAAVIKTMGHRDVKTAMHYQHPELEVVRAALDYGMPNNIAEMQA